MTRIVAFLRGINVGGHIVKKEQLRGAFEALGFRDVTTYKQGGNVIFETKVNDLEKIRSRIEEKLQETLGYDVAVFIRSIEYLKGGWPNKMLERSRKETATWSPCCRPVFTLCYQ